jgi:hypothetical protein
VFVIVLGMLVALVFGLIVTDGFRAVLLGAAVLIGGALLLNRNPNVGARPATPAGPYPVPPGMPPRPAPAATATAPPPGPFPPPPADQTGFPPAYPSAFPPAPPPVTPVTPVSSAPPAPPVQVSPSGGYGPPAGAYGPPAVPYGSPATPPGGVTAPPLPTPLGPPPGGYRQPFAPHGPYAGGGQPPFPPPPVAPPPVPPAPKPPKERSRLGAATFSMVFVALGVVAALDLSNTLHVGPSAYFAGALITVALGLLVGAWFGRARWLIALGVALSIALGISTAAESWDRVGNVGSDVVWQPATLGDLASRYENNFGDARLDLSAVDFTGQSRQITAEVSFGALEVIVPPNVDVTARVEVGAGEARVFGNSWSGVNRPSTAVSDQGLDGPGGGQLDLTIIVNAGDAEVHR